MKTGACALFVALASSAQAQFIDDGVDVNSGAGRIAIVDASDGFSRILQVGEQQFFEKDMYRFVSVVAQRGALYLISLSTGGTACPAVYAWLHTDGAAARVTDEFGNCSDLAEVRSDSETVTVIVPSRVAAEGFVEFVYDGRSIVERIAGQESAGVGLDPEAWIGRYPYEIFRDADWRATLVDLMGEYGYEQAGLVIATSSPMEVQGDWVLGRGFNNRMAGDAYGVVAMNRRDGRILVAIRTQGGLQVWGDVQGTPPQMIADVIEGR